MRTEQIETALRDDWWAGEDEAWEVGVLALARDEPRSLGWALTVWLALVVVSCGILAVVAVAVYRLLGFLAV